MHHVLVSSSPARRAIVQTVFGTTEAPVPRCSCYAATSRTGSPHWRHADSVRLSYLVLSATRAHSAPLSSTRPVRLLSAMSCVYLGDCHKEGCTTRRRVRDFEASEANLEQCRRERGMKGRERGAWRERGRVGVGRKRGKETRKQRHGRKMKHTVGAHIYRCTGCCAVARCCCWCWLPSTLLPSC